VGAWQWLRGEKEAMGNQNYEEYERGRKTGKGSTLSGAKGAQDAAQQRQDKAYQRDLQDWGSKSNREKRSRTHSKSSSGKSGCFVATAAFGDPNAPEVRSLRAYRDESLAQSALGRSLIQFYYTLSPPLAVAIAKSEALQSLIRSCFLRPVIAILKNTKR
jgi:hypothetical protein